MNDQDQMCYFAEQNFKGTYSCGELNVNECSGKDTSCAFYKTRGKFNADKDKAIDRCREKELCTNCKYVDAQWCVKSSSDMSLQEVSEIPESFKKQLYDKFTHRKG